MNTYKQRFRELQRQVATWEQTAQDPQTIEAAREQRSGVLSELHDLLDDEAYRRFVVEHLSREADGQRATCCTCSDSFCAVKRGKVPARVELADDFDQGITAFAAEHPGEPRALLEARTERLQQAEAALEQLERSIVTLKQDTGEPFLPDEDTDDETDAEGGSTGDDAGAGATEAHA